MTIRKTDDIEALNRMAGRDLRQPLPAEPRFNLAALAEIPLTAIDAAIFPLLAARGFDDIRPAHSKVFTVVSGTGSRVTDMAAAASMTKQAMQYLVDDLEQLGYAERIPDPDDRRAKLVRLTAQGRAVVLVARESITATEAEWAALIGVEQMAELRRLLELLTERLLARPFDSQNANRLGNR
jgi:DNA-binding MarR family transcriptional regulator